MVALPGLDDYTDEQLTLARRFSPAFARYEGLLKSPDISALYARRHRTWMQSVLATFFQRAHPETICRFWSQTADTLIDEVWRECGLGDHRVALFALGKHGAEELNLSSDIDVLMVAETTHLAPVEKGLRKFQKYLQDGGEFGFCFRLDFDLRPGGKMGPLITAPSQFQDYYWTQGETWERLALVRLRPLVGPQDLMDKIQDLARRFSFRKFLDFTLLEDLKALRAQVHQKGFQRQDHELHLKLEVGGIRDIELFVHSLLILNGGKLSELQVRSTTRALELLKEKRLLPETEADQLLNLYWDFRQVENLVQAAEDRQTHVLGPSTPELPGLPPRALIEGQMHQADQLVSSLLGRVDLDMVRLPANLAEQQTWLRDLGFSDEAVDSTWELLMKATAVSVKNDRNERARREFLYAFVNELSRHADRDMGLRILSDFVRATRAKATFFSLLLRTPRLIQDLARLFCLSPYLGAILAARPELLDHFILKLDEPWAQSIEDLQQQMSERKLLTEIWAANSFLRDHDLGALFERITATADEICFELLHNLKREFPGSTVEIIALGKWGGAELGLRSDLDLIFVTPETPTETDFKVARRFVSRLTDPQKGGNLFDVDLRLRPSGQSGPLLVPLKKLFQFWEHEAQCWERQAYLRSRSLPPQISLPRELLIQQPLTAEDLDELKRIRGRLLRPPTAGSLDLKYVPGGLLDIEFVAQTAVLYHRVPTSAPATAAMIEALAQAVPTWRSHSERLSALYMELRRFEQVLQLASRHRVVSISPELPTFIKAASLLGCDADSAWSLLKSLIRSSREILNELDPVGLKYDL
ncbi:MAG: glutamine-synthetase adenylyltransferase [Bdellovibrionales bacterium]